MPNLKPALSVTLRVRDTTMAGSRACTVCLPDLGSTVDMTISMQMMGKKGVSGEARPCNHSQLKTQVSDCLKA
jgi:hypothetical protein